MTFGSFRGCLKLDNITKKLKNSIRILRKCSPRYAEKDHQQLVELRSQRDALQEKLANGDRAQVDREQIQGRAQVHQEERSVVPEEGKVLTEGGVLEKGIDF